MRILVRRGYHTVKIYGRPKKTDGSGGYIANWYAGGVRKKKRFKVKDDAIKFAKDILSEVPGYQWHMRPLAYTARNVVDGEARQTSVYFIRSGDLVKIGIAENVKKRMSSHRTSNPGELVLLREIVLPFREAAESLERQLHTRFKDHHASGEWFRITDEDVQNFDHPS